MKYKNIESPCYTHETNGILSIILQLKKHLSAYPLPSKVLGCPFQNLLKLPTYSLIIPVYLKNTDVCDNSFILFSWFYVKY